MTTPINKILINQIQNLSIEELATVSASLSAILGQSGGGSGELCASAWRPTVTDAGVLSWTLTTSTTTPAPVNIMGPQGPSGTNGAKGEDGASIILQSVTDVEGGKQVTLAWGETPSTSSFVIPSGTPGTNGKDGTDGKDGNDGKMPLLQIDATNAHWQVSYDGQVWQDVPNTPVASGVDGKDGITHILVKTIIGILEIVILEFLQQVHRVQKEILVCREKREKRGIRVRLVPRVLKETLVHRVNKVLRETRVTLVHKDFKVYRVKKVTLVLRDLKVILVHLVKMVKMVFHQLFQHL